jgi:hypothetical protein
MLICYISLVNTGAYKKTNLANILPKVKGGPGILDLERFARALQLRWLWFQWRQKERVWNYRVTAAIETSSLLLQ